MKTVRLGDIITEREIAQLVAYVEGCQRIWRPESYATLILEWVTWGIDGNEVGNRMDDNEMLHEYGAYLLESLLGKLIRPTTFQD